MSLLSPLWLLLLVPWAALAAWLLRARGRSVEVPFVDLWLSDEPSAPVKRGRRLPPIHLLVILLALLTLILASARPFVISPHARDDAVLLIVDRGDTMAHDIASPRSAVQLVQSLRHHHTQPMDLRLVPGQDVIRLGMGVTDSQLLDSSTTAVDTRDLVEQLVRDSLRAGRNRLFVVTDHRLAIEDPRLLHIAPEGPPVNMGIEAVAFRPRPTPQLMVRVLNQSPSTRATLVVDGQIRREIDLPPAGQSRAYFIDLPGSSRDHVHVRLDPTDELPADNEAWLVREQSPPRVEGLGDLSPAVRRMLDVYTAARPPTAQSRRVLVMPATEPAPPEAAVLVQRDLPDRLDAASLRIAAHPITADVDWSATLRPGSSVARRGPTDAPGWQPLLEADGRPLMAIHRERDQIWIGFDLDAVATDPAFVVFWSNLLGHFGSEERWGARTPQTLSPPWTRVAPAPLPSDVKPGWVPGLYRDDTGRVIAVNAAARLIPGPPQTNWRERLAQLPPDAHAGFRFAPPLLAASLLLVMLAAFAWPARRARRASVA